MDRLPSKQVEKLLYRIRDAKGGKVSIESLSKPDRDRLKILDKYKFVEGCDPYYSTNEPGSHVIFVGHFYNSVKISTAGMDYLSDLAEERRSGMLRFGRDVLMLIIGAVVTLAVTFLFNQLTGSSDPDNPVPVSQESATMTATPSDSDLDIVE